MFETKFLPSYLGQMRVKQGKNGTLHMAMGTETAAVSEPMGIIGSKADNFICRNGKQWPPKRVTCMAQEGKKRGSKREKIEEEEGKGNEMRKRKGSWCLCIELLCHIPQHCHLT
jgi:hypothetical protein